MRCRFLPHSFAEHVPVYLGNDEEHSRGGDKKESKKGPRLGFASWMAAWDRLVLLQLLLRLSVAMFSCQVCFGSGDYRPDDLR